MFYAVAAAYIIMALLILLGAWLHYKNLTTSLRFTVHVIATALVIIAMSAWHYDFDCLCCA